MNFEKTFFGTKFSISKLWFLVLLSQFVFMYFGLFNVFYLSLAALISLTIHESGHFILAKIFRLNVTKYSLGVFGGSISLNESVIDNKKDLIVSLGGVAANALVLFCLFVSVFDFSLVNQITMEMVHDNLFYALLYMSIFEFINLLPAPITDGGRVLKSVFGLIFKTREDVSFFLMSVFSLFFYPMLFVGSFFLNISLSIFFGIQSVIVLFYISNLLFFLKNKSILENK